MNARAHRAAAIEGKIAEGRWLPPEEYARRTGRPGARLATTQEVRLAASAPAPEVEAGPVAPRATARAAVRAQGAMAAGTALLASGVTFAHDLARGESVGDATRRAAVAGGAAAARSVAVAGASEAVEAAVVRAVAARGAQALATGTVRTAALTAARGVARASVAGQVASLLVDQSIDTVQWARGRIDAKAYGRRTAGNLGGAAGGLAGAAAGAALGSAVPVVGTAIGAAVGGLVGSLGGGHALRRLFG